MRTQRRRVVIYSKDGYASSSAYYRILQYVPAIEKSGIKVGLRILSPEWLRAQRYNVVGSQAPRARSLAIKTAYLVVTTTVAFLWMIYDTIRPPAVVVIIRSIYPKTFFPPFNAIYKRMLTRAKKVIWDCDDNIVDSGELSQGELEILKTQSDLIVLTHEELRKSLGVERAPVRLLPTTDGDLRNVREASGSARETNLRSEVRLIWVGSSAGTRDVVSAEKYLDHAAFVINQSSGRKVELTIVSNKPIQLSTKHLEVRYVAWSRKTAIEELKRAHVGIMPLLPGTFNEGKGAFKLVQYMAAGLPCIASRIGYNQVAIDDGHTGFLVNEEEPSAWVDSIRRVSDVDTWCVHSSAARARWEAMYSAESTEAIWSSMIASE